MKDEFKTEGKIASDPSLLSRRNVMKALGAGTALSAMGGSVSAQSNGDSNSVRPRFGYAATTSEEPPVEPDHEIKLHVRPPREANNPPEFLFEPTGLFVQSGDIVQFTTRQDVHTISSYHPNFHYKQRIPWDSPAISSPVVWPDTYFLYQFDTPGVYDLMCLPHESLGMVARLVVGESTGPGARPVEPAQRAQAGPMGMTLSSPTGAAMTVLNDPALAPERIVENEQVAWDDIKPKNKRIPQGG
jgi:plastocyanin